MIKLLIKYLVLVIAFLMILCSCDINYKLYPSSYSNSTWICNEPYITYSPEPKLAKTAETIINGEKIAFDLCFSATTVEAWQYKEENGEIIGDKILFKGTCEYSEEKFIVKIDTDSDILFNGEYEELIFIRE